MSNVEELNKLVERMWELAKDLEVYMRGRPRSPLYEYYEDDDDGPEDDTYK